MTKTKRLSFGALRIDAGFCGATLERLARKLKDNPSAAPLWQFDDYDGCYDEEPAEMAFTINAIARCLDIIGQTPNAYINQEALDEFQERVERARHLLEEQWAVELLGRLL
jgi:hypothetical protein